MNPARYFSLALLPLLAFARPAQAGDAICEGPGSDPRRVVERPAFGGLVIDRKHHGVGVEIEIEADGTVSHARVLEQNTADGPVDFAALARSWRFEPIADWLVRNPGCERWSKFARKQTIHFGGAAWLAMKNGKEIAGEKAE